MLLLILKSSACLAVFMLFYKLFLEKESIHHFKRFYLLGALLVSIIIPFITFTQYIEVEPIQGFVPFEPLEFSTTESVIPKATTWQDYIPTVLWSIYFIGVALFSFRFALNLRAIFHRIRTNPKHQYRGFTNVLIPDLIHPHTFFKYIFLNKRKYEHNLIPNEVLLHEQTHAKQKHALDILCVEVLQIIFWFNPLLYFIKKYIKLNHEFLADQAVLQKGIDAAQYKQTLLAFSSKGNETPLANAINYSLIKKRFTVMKSNTSKQAFWLRSLVLLPILAILIYSFSGKEIVEKEVALVEPSEIQQINTEKGATEAMMKEYDSFIKSTEESTIIIHDKLQRAIAIYDMMTEAQRATVKKHPKAPSINLASTKPKSLSTSEFNSWKNSSKFAIWIDGKVVENSELDNYAASDFTYHTSSFVYNNARSKRFPQPYQNHLYTKKGFEEAYLKSNVKAYSTLRNKYQEQRSLKKDDSELRILRSRLDRAYKSLTKEEIEKYDIKQPPPKPSDNTKTGKEPIGKLSQTNEGATIHTTQEGATQEQIAEYNRLAKQFSKNPNRIIKSKEVNRLKYLYSIMSVNQKKEAESFPQITPTPPPPMDTIYTYKRLAKRVQKIPKNRKANIVYLKEIYSKMDILQKNKVDSPKKVLKNLWGQGEATAQMISEYNALAKKYNSQSRGNKSIPNWNQDLLESIYASMTDKQKASAEPFPDFPEPPPPPKAPNAAKVKKGEKSNIPPPPSTPSNLSDEAFAEKVIDKTIANQDPYDHSNYKYAIINRQVNKEWTVSSGANRDSKTSNDQLPIPPVAPTIAVHANTNNYSKELKTAISKYLEKNKAYEESIETYSKKGKGNRQELWDSYNKAMELYVAYYDLARKEDNFVQPMPPIAPRVLKGEVSEIPTPPTPPEPKSPLDHIIEMAKEGAIFYYGDKKISLKKAKEIVSTEKHLGISTYHINNAISVKLFTEDPTNLSKAKSPLDHVIEIAKGDAKFYYNNSEISSDKAIRLLKKNKELTVSTRYENNINVVKLYTKPILIKN